MRLFNFLFAVAFMSSCTAQSRGDRIREFLKYLKENNEHQIYAISYHLDSKSNIIANDESRRGYVSSASALLNKDEPAPENTWVTEQIPGGVSIVEIPLFAANDTTVQATISLYFPPPGVSDRVYNFSVFRHFDRTHPGKIILVAPKIDHGN